MSIKSINPFSGEVVKIYKEHSPEQINEKISQTHKMFFEWRETSFAQRKSKMKKLARLLREQKNYLAILMANEMGKPVRDGRSEAEKCAWVCDYYADNAEYFLAPETISTDAQNSFITFRPLGVILAVMPWNFPLWQVFRFAAPGLMAGNAGLLKHASNVNGCALEIEKLFVSAGFPEHIFTTLLVPGQKAESIIENPAIAAVTLTGSTAAGRAVAQKAGSLLKKTVLELGGSDPYIVLDDADLSKAITACVTGRLINNGQSCIAAKRFIVTPQIADAFEEGVVKLMQSNRMGDPLEETTDLGPMARHDLRDELHDQVKRSLSNGAKCLLGGKIPEGIGAFYPPTVLTFVTSEMPVFKEETFGPVAAIIRARNENEAITLANQSSFGLGSAIFTEDVEKGIYIASNKINAGSCFVNAFVKSDPRLPFGGVKQSGYGRELSHFGIKEFVNIKTVYVS